MRFIFVLGTMLVACLWLRARFQITVTWAYLSTVCRERMRRGGDRWREWTNPFTSPPPGRFAEVPPLGISLDLRDSTMYTGKQNNGDCLKNVTNVLVREHSGESFGDLFGSKSTTRQTGPTLRVLEIARLA